jgi:hypothetical protein
MDPVTAALQAFRAFNDFLCTPAGQKLADLNTSLIQTTLTKLHIRVLADPPAAKPA